MSLEIRKMKKQEGSWRAWDGHLNGVAENHPPHQGESVVGYTEPKQIILTPSWRGVLSGPPIVENENQCVRGVGARSCWYTVIDRAS